MKLNVAIKQTIHWPMISLFSLLVIVTGSIPAVAEIQGPVEETLVPVSTVAPKYPLKAYQQQLAGEVVVSFVVNKQGLVEEVDVVETSQGGVFDQAVINAVSQWTFEPLSRSKQARQTLKFNLD